MVQLADSSPELRAFHDASFAAAEAAGGDIYESPDNWSPVKRTGHFRRMAILAELLPEDMFGKTAVDFGSGPWGFGCIAPILRTASRCICMDVSQRALDISRAKESEIAERVAYIVSDGENIPLPDDSVDVFWAGEVIEHVRLPAKFMEEVARICRHGALVLLSTPNRDAIFYRVRGEDNTIGPEHIALMNHAELKALLSRFCSRSEIFGYETSLFRDLDFLEYSEAELESIQRRAWNNPETASGMVASGLIDKQLASRNSRGWHLDENLWSAYAAADGSVKPVRLLDGVDGGFLNDNARLSASLKGDLLIILFWAHDWSGFVNIGVNGLVRVVDLYSRDGGFRRVEFTADTGKFDLTIHRIGEKSARSVADQVILYKIMVYSATR